MKRDPTEEQPGFLLTPNPGPEMHNLMSLVLLSDSAQEVSSISQPG